MDDKTSNSPKESNNNKNNTSDPEIIRNNNIIKVQKTKYFINKHYQRFIGFIFFLIGCYFLFFLFSFVFSIYVSSLFNLININSIVQNGHIFISMYYNS